MDNRQFVEDYKEAFGEKATLPIAFWHSDTPVAVPESVNGCFFPAFERSGRDNLLALIAQP